MEGKTDFGRLANTPLKVVSPYQPSGDQPQAIEKLAKGIEDGLRYQTLLGVTGSGKTFTMAKVIEAVQRPTLILAPNKTLAAQLASELKEMFPDNAVVYFVSYYDYYQPEAYVPSSDTFIEKDASINEEVEKLRHAATSALLSRRDVIVVASVSCIYGIGSPQDYAGMAVFLDKGQPTDRDEVIYGLIDIQYDRNDYELKRGTFRVRGDSLDVFPPYADNPIRIDFWGDEIEEISEIDGVTGEVLNTYNALPVWPASHYVTARPKMNRAIGTIRDELRDRLQQFNDEGKLLEAQRLEMRTNYDLEMLETMGFCSGIENYSRHMDGRAPGETSCASSTRATSASRRSAACTRATDRARSRLPSTASAFRRPSTTGRCASTSSRTAYLSSSTSRPRRATTRRRSARPASSRSSVRRACSTPSSR